MTLRFITFIAFLSLGMCSFAQVDSTAKTRTPRACEVHLKDGSSYKGYIDKQSDSLIYLRGSSGVQVTIPKKQVSEIDFITEHAQKDTVNFTHLHTIPSIANRYYVTSSNTLPFRPRELWVSTNYAVLYHINYAFDKHFAMGVTTSLIGAPIGINVKASFELGYKYHLGFEGVAGGLSYLGPKTYGVGGVMKLTFGDERKNYTFFAGFMDAEFWKEPRRGRRGGRPVGPSYYVSYVSPFAGAAASLPLTPRMNFVTEAFAFPNISIYTGSAALRTTKWKKASVVFGIQVIGNFNTAVNRSFTLPYFGLSFNL